MADKSGIQWTDATWNCVTGCDKVSPGCSYCYAETVADRFWATQYRGIPIVDLNKPGRVGGAPNSTRPRVFTDVQCHDDRLDQPLRWKRPRRIFVNSMSDLFHEDVPDTFILTVFSIMEKCPQHTFQVLTKRAERMRDMVSWLQRKWADEDPPTPFPLSNVWLGVSVENQHWADIRVPQLLETPAAVRFVSYEPALGAVNFLPWLKMFRNDHVVDPTGVAYQSLDWVIVGGESGKHARGFDLAWARSAVEQCRQAGVACFVKQLGAAPYGLWETEAMSPAPYPKGRQWDLKDSHGGDWDEWPADLRVREYPQQEAV